jgi:subtilisin family serine protease
MPFQLSVLARAAMALALIGGAACATAADAPPAAKPRIEKAADLPRFSYKIDGKVEDLVRDGSRFAPFAAQVRRDTESVLANYDIPDKATRRGLLLQLAALDFLDAKYDSVLARLDEARALEEKPADKLLSGMRLRAMASAARAQGTAAPGYPKSVAAALNDALKPLPYDIVGNDLKENKMGAELLGEGRIYGNLREVLQPVVDKSGSLSSDLAPGVVNARYALVAVLPLKQTFVETFTAYLAAHQVQKPDIWAARDVVLKPGENYKPVVVAIWDSGVDTKLYGNQVVRDAKGEPAVIAFDKYSRPATGELEPIPAELRGKLPQMTARSKGLSDLTSNIDSPEAAEVRNLIANLSPEQYRATIEELRLTGNYEHGTHVAGIVVAGDPYARLVVARIEFGHTLKPDPCPSQEQVERDAKARGAYVDFMKKQHVRVTNMSWGGDVASYESDLEKCGIGKTPEERKALARKYFDIDKTSLTEAMASAPEILFVAAAGNEDSDASFTESIPAGIVLPNLLTVGAVDRAGDEASFTSYGPTVKVHANGYQVESYLPGGTRVALSGTSMAAPQVTGLAAKLLAVDPRLTPADLVRVITGTTERTADGRRFLMDPKKALAQVQAGLQK